MAELRIRHIENTFSKSSSQCTACLWYRTMERQWRYTGSPSGLGPPTLPAAIPPRAHAAPELLCSPTGNSRSSPHPQVSNVYHQPGPEKSLHLLGSHILLLHPCPLTASFLTHLSSGLWASWGQRQVFFIFVAHTSIHGRCSVNI